MLVSVYPESTTLRPSKPKGIGCNDCFFFWFPRSNASKWHFLPQSWKGKITPNKRKLLLEGTISHFHDYGKKGKELWVLTNFVFLHTSLSFISGFRCALFFFLWLKGLPNGFPNVAGKPFDMGNCVAGCAQPLAVSWCLDVWRKDIYVKSRKTIRNPDW